MYRKLWQRLAALYGDDEAKAIVRLVLEARFGFSWSDILCGKESELSAEDMSALEIIIQRLEQGEPVQYLLGQAEFGGRQFKVNKNVLIPRPETYELCQWIISDVRCKRGDVRDYSILDIGTGSGCIACTLAAEIPGAQVSAWDVSDDALAIARENAQQLGVSVNFSNVDILSAHSSFLISHLSFIISNPPYICNKERVSMERNVLEHEPELALFVPDDDPLLFYRAIADFALHALNQGGALFFEINPIYVDELQILLKEMSYIGIEVRDDMFGKPRFIKAVKS